MKACAKWLSDSGVGKGTIRCSTDSGSAGKHPVMFKDSQELQKWLRMGVVDFAEIFKGCGELTIRVHEAGGLYGIGRFRRSKCFLRAGSYASDGFDAGSLIQMTISATAHG